MAGTARAWWQGRELIFILFVILRQAVEFEILWSSVRRQDLPRLEQPKQQLASVFLVIAFPYRLTQGWVAWDTAP